MPNAETGGQSVSILRCCIGVRPLLLSQDQVVGQENGLGLKKVCVFVEVCVYGFLFVNVCAHTRTSIFVSVLAAYASSIAFEKHPICKSHCSIPLLSRLQ